MFTYVALPFQVKELTGSYPAVGLVEIIPLVIFGLYGGVLADHMDRKKDDLGNWVCRPVLINNLQLYLVAYFASVL